MKDYLFSPINSDFVAQCHELNEKNVPNVGTKSLDGFINLVENSDYNECILKNNEVVGYVVCFQDIKNTINSVVNFDDEEENRSIAQDLKTRFESADAELIKELTFSLYRTSIFAD